jgi:hypothetical protein
VAIAGEISGSIRYDIGSVGWKMLKIWLHFGLEDCMSECETDAAPSEALAFLLDVLGASSIGSSMLLVIARLRP